MRNTNTLRLKEETREGLVLYSYSHKTLNLTNLTWVSHNLLFSLKSSVVDVKSEAQTKRVYHALHEETTCQRCGYKSSSRGDEAKQVCLYGFSLKLIAGNRLNPLLNRS